jgi:hypothetical protein
MSRFSPMLGESVRLFGDTFTFQEHPQAPGMTFASQGGRAMVYQVKSTSGDKFGLKVFSATYRNELVLESCRHLKELERYPGLLAAQRRIVPVEDPIVFRVPDLKYAVLMPWVPGKTWFDWVATAESKGSQFELDSAERVAKRFLSVLATLERDSIAHTDISGGNVVVNAATGEAELLDLEEIYMPGKPEPPQAGPGTLYYQHRAGASTWKPEGDRYAAGILASEILLMAEESLARKITTSGFYEGGEERFKDACHCLKETAPYFLDVFKRTWSAESLEECPKIADLRDGLMKGRPPRITTPPGPEIRSLDPVINADRCGIGRTIDGNDGKSPSEFWDPWTGPDQFWEKLDRSPVTPAEKPVRSSTAPIFPPVEEETFLQEHFVSVVGGGLIAVLIIGLIIFFALSTK